MIDLDQTLALLQELIHIPSESSGWNESCRTEFAPAEKQRIATAHVKHGLDFAKLNPTCQTLQS